MSRENIINMAREAGLGFSKGCAWGTHAGTQRFAALVIEDFLNRTGQYVTNDASREAAIQAAVLVEREACAKVCDAEAAQNARMFSDDSSLSIAASECADAIRARNTA